MAVSLVSPRRCQRFGVNVLGAEHAEYVRHAAHADANRFAGIDYELAESGVRRIRSAIAFLDCEPVSEQPAGDHWIVIARVQAALADGDREPLVFSDGNLGSFQQLKEFGDVVPPGSARSSPG